MFHPSKHQCQQIEASEMRFLDRWLGTREKMKRKIQILDRIRSEGQNLVPKMMMFHTTAPVLEANNSHFCKIVELLS